MSSAAQPSLQVKQLRGWQLPFLQDPCFTDLLPLLQRCLLLQGPERLLQRLAPRPSLASETFVAFRDPQAPLGLVVSQRLNRSGSCWQIQHLRRQASLEAGEAGRMAIEAALVGPRSRGARMPPVGSPPAPAPTALAWVCCGNRASNSSATKPSGAGNHPSSPSI